MNSRKWISLSLSMSALVLVTTFQNCAPAGPGLQNSIGSDGFNHIIDDVTSTAGLTFNEKIIAVPASDNEVVAQGACFEEQNGAILNWKLIDPFSDQIVRSGYAGCQAGSFEVAINDLQDIDCGDYLIQARLGLGEMGLVELDINCN